MPKLWMNVCIFCLAHLTYFLILYPPFFSPKGYQSVRKTLQSSTVYNQTKYYQLIYHIPQHYKFPHSESLIVSEGVVIYLSIYLCIHPHQSIPYTLSVVFRKYPKKNNAICVSYVLLFCIMYHHHIK